MSKRTFQGLSLLTILTFITFPNSPLPALAQSAIGQLEAMTGQRINPLQLRGMPQANLGAIGGMIGLMMLQSVITVAMQAGTTHNAGLTRGQAAQRAELEAWMKAEQQRLADLVKQQRAKRDAEDKASIEQMAAVLSEQWDGARPASDLASALSDPNVVVQNPTGTQFFGQGGGSATMEVFSADGSKPAVDLSQRNSDMPSIPGRQNQVSSLPTAKTAPAVRNVQLRSQAARKLQTMIKENHNPKILDKRLQSLEDELQKAILQAEELRDNFQATAKEYDLYEKRVGSVTRTTLMRGLSLALDIGPDLIVKSSGEALVKRLDALRYDPKKWNRTLQAMDNINNVAMVTSEGILYAQQSKEIYEYECEVWNRSEGDLKKDLDFIAENLPVLSENYKIGKFMVNTALDIRKDFVELKDLECTTKAYLGKQQQIDIKIKRLTKAIKEERQQLASKQGV